MGTGTGAASHVVAVVVKSSYKIQASTEIIANY